MNKNISFEKTIATLGQIIFIELIHSIISRKEGNKLTVKDGL